MYKRTVVKIGTGALSTPSGELDIHVLGEIVSQIVLLREKGMEVVLVTSGAVGAGKSMLSKREGTTAVIEKQLYAAVGQVKLMNIYSELFEKHGYMCAQVLATKEDFRDEVHYQNMKNCLNALLPDGIVPIVNENDVVATTELMFTDNDELAGLIAEQLEADVLIVLTTTNGVLDADGNTVSEVSTENAAQVLGYINEEASATGRGGMRTKFNVAKGLSEKGIRVYIADGKAKNVLADISEGRACGTCFLPR